MKKLYFILIAVFLFTLTGTALAAEFRAGNQVYLESPISEDAYLAGELVEISENVRGDVFVAGGNVIISGNISEDLVVAGGKVLIRGTVNGDVRALGGEVTVRGTVDEDLLAAGGYITIEDTARIGGDVATSAGAMTLNGRIDGDLKSYAGKIYLGGLVGGNAKLRSQDRIVLTKDARIRGNLDYYSPMQSEIAQGMVSGEVTYNEIKGGIDRETAQDIFKFSILIGQFLLYLSLLLLGLILIMIAPGIPYKAADRLSNEFLKDLGIGLLLVLLSLPLLVLAIISGVGIPVAIIILFMLIIYYFLAKIIIGAWLGIILFKKSKNPSKWQTFGKFALGLLILQIVTLVPFLGKILSIILMLAAIGALTLIKKEIYQFLVSKKQI